MMNHRIPRCNKQILLILALATLSAAAQTTPKTKPKPAPSKSSAAKTSPAKEQPLPKLGLTVEKLAGSRWEIHTKKPFIVTLHGDMKVTTNRPELNYPATWKLTGGAVPGTQGIGIRLQKGPKDEQLISGMFHSENTLQLLLVGDEILLGGDSLFTTAEGRRLPAEKTSAPSARPSTLSAELLTGSRWRVQDHEPFEIFLDANQVATVKRARQTAQARWKLLQPGTTDQAGVEVTLNTGEGSRSGIFKTDATITLFLLGANTPRASFEGKQAALSAYDPHEKPAAQRESPAAPLEAEFRERLSARLAAPAERPLDRLLQAEALRYFNRNREAWAIYDELARQHPDSAMLFCHRAMACLETGDQTGFARELAEATAADKESPYVFAAAAAGLQAEGKFAEAETFYARVFAANPYIYGLRGRRALNRDLLPNTFSDNLLGSILEIPALTAAFPWRLPAEKNPPSIDEKTVLAAERRLLARGDLLGGIAALEKTQQALQRKHAAAPAATVPPGAQAQPSKDFAALLYAGFSHARAYIALGDYHNAARVIHPCREQDWSAIPQLISRIKAYQEGAIASLPGPGLDMRAMLYQLAGKKDKAWLEAVNQMLRDGNWSLIAQQYYGQAPPLAVRVAEQPQAVKEGVFITTAAVVARARPSPFVEDQLLVLWREVQAYFAAHEKLQATVAAVRKNPNPQAILAAQADLAEQQQTLAGHSSAAEAAYLAASQSPSIAAREPLTRHLSPLPPGGVEQLRALRFLEPQQLRHFASHKALRQPPQESAAAKREKQFRAALLMRHAPPAHADLPKSVKLLQEFLKTTDNPLEQYAAQFALGEAYEYGWGVPRDFSQAQAHYAQAGALRETSETVEVDEISLQSFGSEEERTQIRWDITARQRWRAVKAKQEQLKIGQAVANPTPAFRADLAERTESPEEKQLAEVRRCTCPACRGKIYDLASNKPAALAANYNASIAPAPLAAAPSSTAAHAQTDQLLRRLEADIAALRINAPQDSPERSRLIAVLRKYFDQAVAADPKYAAARFARGLFLAEHTSDRSAILTDFSQAVELEPKNLLYRRREIESLHGYGLREVARPKAEQALAVYRAAPPPPSDEDQLLIFLTFVAEDWRETVRLCDAWQAAHPKLKPPHRFRGLSYVALGKLQEAANDLKLGFVHIDFVRDYRARNPNLTAAELVQLAEELSQVLLSDEKLLALYQRAIVRDPSAVAAYRGQALLQYKMLRSYQDRLVGHQTEVAKRRALLAAKKTVKPPLAPLPPPPELPFPPTALLATLEKLQQLGAELPERGEMLASLERDFNVKVPPPRPAWVLEEEAARLRSEAFYSKYIDSSLGSARDPRLLEQALEVWNQLAQKHPQQPSILLKRLEFAARHSPTLTADEHKRYFDAVLPLLAESAVHERRSLYLQRLEFLVRHGALEQGRLEWSRYREALTEKSSSLGWLLFDLGLPREAYDILWQLRGERGLEQPVAILGRLFLEPKTAAEYAQRGAVRGILNDQQAAVADYTEALNLAPRSVLALCWRAGRQISLGNAAAAEADLAAALLLDPRSSEAYATRGALRQAQLRLDEALADYARALELNPLRNEARQRRAVIFYYRGDLPALQAELLAATYGLPADHPLLAPRQFALPPPQTNLPPPSATILSKQADVRKLLAAALQQLVRGDLFGAQLALERLGQLHPSDRQLKFALGVAVAAREEDQDIFHYRGARSLPLTENAPREPAFFESRSLTQAAYYFSFSEPAEVGRALVQHWPGPDPSGARAAYRPVLSPFRHDAIYFSGAFRDDYIVKTLAPTLTVREAMCQTGVRLIRDHRHAARRFGRSDSPTVIATGLRLISQSTSAPSYLYPDPLAPTEPDQLASVLALRQGAELLLQASQQPEHKAEQAQFSAAAASLQQAVSDWPTAVAASRKSAASEPSPPPPQPAPPTKPEVIPKPAVSPPPAVIPQPAGRAIVLTPRTDPAALQDASKLAGTKWDLFIEANREIVFNADHTITVAGEDGKKLSTGSKWDSPDGKTVYLILNAGLYALQGTITPERDAISGEGRRGEEKFSWIATPSETPAGNK